MIKTRKKTIDINEEYIECDECKHIIEEYGNSWFTLIYKIGKFRDDCGESSTYHFCNQKECMLWLNKHKTQNIALSELIKK